MEISNLLASIIITNRLKKQLDEQNIKDSRERLLWWFENRQKYRIGGNYIKD